MDDDELAADWVATDLGFVLVRSGCDTPECRAEAMAALVALAA